MFCPSSETLCLSFHWCLLWESDSANLRSLLASPQDEKANGPEDTTVQSSDGRSLLVDVIQMPRNVSTGMCQGVKMQVSGNVQSHGFCFFYPLISGSGYVRCATSCLILCDGGKLDDLIHPFAHVGCSLHSCKPHFLYFILSFLDYHIDYLS